MLSHKKSLNILKKTNALLEGHFILSSGLHSSKYIQCAKLLSFPHLAKNICESLARKIKKNYKSIDLNFFVIFFANDLQILSARCGKLNNFAH